MKESFETRDDGLVKVSKTKLNIQEFILAGNNETYDIYKIEEAETPYNYFKIADDQDIYLTVNKKATTDENGNYTGIKVDSIKLTLNRGTEDEVSTEAGKTVTLENVKLEKQIKTVDIKAQLIEVTNDETGEVMPTIIVTVPNEETAKLKELTRLKIDGDFAQISWGLKIVDVTFDKPYVTLTYRNANGDLNKVFAECRDIENFDKEKVLEKALLKAFQNEIINITVIKNK